MSHSEGDGHGLMVLSVTDNISVPNLSFDFKRRGLLQNLQFSHVRLSVQMSLAHLVGLSLEIVRTLLEEQSRLLEEQEVPGCRAVPAACISAFWQRPRNFGLSRPGQASFYLAQGCAAQVHNKQMTTASVTWRS